MAKLTRVFQKVFGRTAAAAEIGQFGSLAAGSPTTTNDPAVMQSLGNWDAGWFSAILGNNSPAIEDMNSLFFVAFRQLAYIMQQGIAEHDVTTEYHKGSKCLGVNGMIYESLTDTNTGNVVTDGTKWILSSQRNFIKTSIASETLSIADEIILVSATVADITLTLPAAATSKGKVYKVKKIDKTLFKVILDPNAAELIEGVSSIKIGNYLESYTMVCDGTGWYLI